LTPNLLSRAEIEAAFQRLGELAQAEGETVEFVVLGGTAMVLAFDARPSTKDVDIAPLPSSNSAKLRSLASRVAAERNWANDWLNDAAKGFLHGQLSLTVVYNQPGIRVYRPSTAQLLAMKLTAWRDDVDVADAALLLSQLDCTTVDEAWNRVEKFIIPGLELKAKYALEDLWQDRK